MCRLYNPVVKQANLTDDAEDYTGPKADEKLEAAVETTNGTKAPMGSSLVARTGEFAGNPTKMASQVSPRTLQTEIG